MGECSGLKLQLPWAPADFCPDLSEKQVPEGKEMGVCGSVKCV